MPRSNLAWSFVGLCALLAASCAAPPPGESVARTPPEETVAPTQPEEPPPGLEFVPPKPGTYRLPPIQPAADGNVIDADGTERRLFDYFGDKCVLLSFVYTLCTDSKGCPLATAILQMVNEELVNDPGLAQNVRLVTLSFDPERDTPEMMRKYTLYAGDDYLETDWTKRPWVFLTTESKDQVQRILDGYGQYIVPEIDESGDFTGNFMHVLKVYLIDRQRKVRNIYSSSFIDPVTAINDLKTILMKDAGPS